MMTRALPLRVDYVPGESATSFASRLARRKGVPRLVPFCSDIGIDYGQLTNGAPTEIERLAALGGTDPAAMQFWTPRLVGDGWFELGHATLKFTCFRRTHARTCPVCMSAARQRPEDVPAVHHGLWQLESIRTCHIHGSLLVPLAQAGTGKDVFDIVPHLRTYAPTPAVHVADKDRHLENWLADQIATGQETRRDWFHGLPIHVAVQTAENLGALMTLGADAKRTDISEQDWVRAGNAGYMVLRDGLEAMLATLREIQSLTPIDARLHRHRFRLFYNWLRDRDEDPAFDVIRDSVRDYIWSNFPVAEGAIILGQPAPEQRVHTPATAAAMAGVSRWKIEQHLIRRGLASARDNGQGVHLNAYPTSENISEITTQIHGMISATQAGDILGVTLATLRLLRTEGLVSHAAACPKNGSYFEEGEISDFMRKLRALAKPEQHAPEDAVLFRDAALQCQTSLAKVVACVLDNRLPLFATAPADARFGDLLVSIRAIRQTTTIPAEDALSLGEASLRLKTNTRTIRALLKRGHIVHVQPFSDAKHRRWQVICARSVEEFSTTHISLTELACRRNRDAANLSKDLYSYGIRPLRLGDKCQRFFRRRDVI